MYSQYHDYNNKNIIYQIANNKTELKFLKKDVCIFRTANEIKTGPNFATRIYIDKFLFVVVD